MGFASIYFSIDIFFVVVVLCEKRVGGGSGANWVLAPGDLYALKG